MTIKSLLSFFGRDTGFGEKHTNAFFINQDELVIIDCSMTSFEQLKSLTTSIQNEISKISILVTHTHSDHIGGIGMYISFAHYVTKKPVTVITATESQSQAVFTYLQIEGVHPNVCEFEIQSYKVGLREWLIRPIQTQHDLNVLSGCFGYQLNIYNRNVIYTGDTTTLEPFKPYITDGTFLYTEASSTKSPVHLLLSNIKEYLRQCTEHNINVFLMHLNNESEIRQEIAGTNIRIAPLYNES